MIDAVPGVILVGFSLRSAAGRSLNTRNNRRAIQHGLALFLVVMAGFIAVKESVSLFTTGAEPPTPAREVEP